MAFLNRLIAIGRNAASYKLMIRHLFLAVFVFACVYLVYINSIDLQHTSSSSSSTSSSSSSSVANSRVSRFSIGRFVVCDKDEYKCEGRLSVCVKRYQLCDRKQDCPLGDDETDCFYSQQCPSSTFFCNRVNQTDGGCLYLKSLCDYHFNCTLDARLEHLCFDFNASTSTSPTKLKEDPSTLTTLSTIILSNESSTTVKNENDVYSHSNSTTISFSQKPTSNSPQFTLTTTKPPFRSSSSSKPHRKKDLEEPEVTTSFTHIEHVSEVPSSGPSNGFDFQPFFKPFFDTKQMPFANFMNTGSQSQTKSNQANSNANKFDYTKQFDFSKFMGSSKSESSSSNQTSSGSGSPFDYSKFMKGGGSSGGGSSFDYSKFMKGGGGMGNNSSGAGSFDYSTYMSGKPPEPPSSGKPAKKNFHKADYLKFYENNSDKQKTTKDLNETSVDFVPIDHRSDKQLLKKHTPLISALSSNGNSSDTSNWSEDNDVSESNANSTMEVDDSLNSKVPPTDSSIESSNTKSIDSKWSPNASVQKWPPHTDASQIPNQKGNAVNVSKIIPKTMLNGYSYTHYGSGVFFINFGTIVNGNSNIMGSGNDVGNGNANGNNNGNTQGDNLKSNTNNRNEETDKS